MISIMTILILLCIIKFSVLMTTNAAFLHPHHMQAIHELGYHHQATSPALSRKLMHKTVVQGYRYQDFVMYNFQKEAVLGETHKRGEKVMVIGAKGPDPTHFTTMDYSHVRRRRPIHNNYSPKSTNSP